MRRNAFRKNKKNAGVNLLGIVVIILAAVLAGFLITRFVVYPIMLGTSEGISFQRSDTATEEKVDPSLMPEESKDTAKEEPQSNVEESVEENAEGKGDSEQQAVSTQSGYCIQFGSFSTKEAADKLVNELKQGGITSSVTEKDGVYKVIGEIFADKESARAAAALLDRAVYSDIFVTQV